MIPSVYTPPPGEYVRPRGVYLFEVDQRASFDNHYVRGAFAHQSALARYGNGVSILVELVPEPGNPHDAWAVAFRVDENRIGYLASSHANGLHEYIAGHNRQGRAVYAHGMVRVEPGETERRATVFLPWWRDQLAFHEASGIYEECDRLIEALPEEARERIMRTSQDLTPADVRLVWKERAAAPELVWTKQNPQKIPTALRYRLIDWDRSRAQQARALAEAERERARIAKAEKLTAKNEAKELAKKQFEDSICRLAGEGHPKTAIARMVECSENTVRSVLNSRGIPAVNANDASRAARLERGRLALALQREGATRRSIAVYLGCGLETVKSILKDAKFFEEPSSDMGRLSRAIQVAGVSRIVRVDEAAQKLGWTGRETQNARSDAVTLAFMHPKDFGHVS